MPFSKNKIIIDFLKLNHWINARKITNYFLKKKHKKLSQKIKSKKNFIATPTELEFINNDLLIPTEKIIFKKNIPDYLFWSKNKIEKTKRPIMRDGMHFYNYYSLPIPEGFVGPVILDILCPKKKLPKLNNGHLEQAITINLGNSDIYGRWGKKINKNNFSKIKFNDTHKNSWIIGDTYVEPTYCPHSYSRATKMNSKILSYTAKSPLEKFIKNLNGWSDERYSKLIKNLKLYDFRASILNFYLNNHGIEIKYLSKLIKIKINNVNHIVNNKKILLKTCKLLKLNPDMFFKKMYKGEDGIGKSYLSFKESFKTIRKFKSYAIASMASSERYPDLIGNFVKVSNKKKIKDLCDYASSHYLVTGGKMSFNVKNKKINISKGDAIWISPFLSHGFSGEGSLIKISNGESLDTSDLNQILNIYKPLQTIKRSYKDSKTWGYE